MIIRKNNIFLLQTPHTSWLFHILPSGHPEHLHYGSTLIGSQLYESLSAGPAQDAGDMLLQLETALEEKHIYGGGNMIAYDQAHTNLCLEDLCLEMSSFGKGDIRDPFVEITHPDGSSTCDFLFEKAEITTGRKPLETLPGSYDEGTDQGADPVQQLTVTMYDHGYGVHLELIYTVYPDCDVITRSARILYDGAQEDSVITLNRLMSTQIDFHDSGYRFTSFHGRWADEMQRSDALCMAGKVVNEELAAGESGSRSNPFVMISREGTSEDQGECYGMNLVYSGNHYEALSSNGYDKSRFVCGIQPTGFSWKLHGGEYFEAPEAVMTWSDEGMNGMSRHMHDFVRRHIVRGSWRDRERPILVNSWEASYFKFTQASLLNLAKSAKSAGIELFVLDDGWFGQRDDDHRSLGDWTENLKKLPDGLKGLSEKINALGMMFGIWVEPEMVNEDSDLFRAHPDWAIRVPGHAHSQGRNQMLLDLTRSEVQQYVIDAMSKVFSSGNITYVKWDMNRIFSDTYSQALDADRQQEVSHRYVCGLYHCMDELTKRFPDILFEGCSSGGNRFDLGILCYFPQIWGSDDTDAVCRIDIQHGYSYGYPASTIGAHVSASPNHQTLNRSPLETRFEVAAFGCLGYELNLCDLSDAEKKEIADQVAFYKEWRHVFQFGDYYRLDKDRWMATEKDGSRAAVMMFRRESRPNRDTVTLTARGLNTDAAYHLTNRYVNVALKDFGSLINSMDLPVHVKQDGIMHDIANRFVTIHNEEENMTVSGCVLNGCGVRLKPFYAGTGFGNDGGVRVCRSGDSRIYLLEALR